MSEIRKQHFKQQYKQVSTEEEIKYLKICKTDTLKENILFTTRKGEKSVLKYTIFLKKFEKGLNNKNNILKNETGCPNNDVTTTKTGISKMWP